MSFIKFSCKKHPDAIQNYIKELPDIDKNSHQDRSKTPGENKISCKPVEKIFYK
jgi:hypothetical protein